MFTAIFEVNPQQGLRTAELSVCYQLQMIRAPREIARTERRQARRAAVLG